MSAAKKFKDNYPKDRVGNQKADGDIDQTRRDKIAIQGYKDKIQDLLSMDPKAQKKAADIITALINSKN
ncbi:MAG: hypothetical protein KC478_07375 [Bacteriovoracaceae bacterium]|nr:hypothetical protein [Bacteriovoracaceae bacterium]